MNDPKTGDTVTTQKYVGELKKGEVKTLTTGTYIHSINSDLLICNGWTIGDDFKAKFIEEVVLKCDGTSLPASTYTRFEIL